jgi:hypothetical protein
MKRVSFPLSVLSIVAIVLSAGQLPAQSPAAIAVNKTQQAGALPTELAGPKSGLIATLLRSRQGRLLLESSQSPLAQSLRKRLGLNEVLQPSGISDARVSTAPASEQFRPEALNSDCGVATGTRFNLEPRTNALPQNSTTVDFLPNAGLKNADLVVGGAADLRGFIGASLGNSISGYYVHRNGQDKNPCFPDFEGGLPSVTDPSTNDVLFGSGDVIVESDPVRNAVFMADGRSGLTVSAIGVFRSTAATLDDAAACPSGTHSEAQSKTCWPVSAELTPVQNGFDLAPHLAVDQRELGKGMGAGDVYASFIVDVNGGAQLVLTACKNDLSACSSPVVVNGNDPAITGANSLRIRPDIATHLSNSVTITYVNVTTGGPPDFLQTFDIKYVTCTPQGAPAAPVCSNPKLVTSETQPIPGVGGGDNGGGFLNSGALAAAQFQLFTSPKHEHRQDANGVETYVVWERCKVMSGGICPDADVVLAASNDNGATWHFEAVDASAGDQYMPAIFTDPSTNIINIAYYSTQGDKLNHRPRVLFRQILPGPKTPDPVSNAQTITTLALEPAADFLLGDRSIGGTIGIAARGNATQSHAYIHYMHNAVNGSYNGVRAPEQNNHMSAGTY